MTLPCTYYAYVDGKCIYLQWLCCTVCSVVVAVVAAAAAASIFSWELLRPHPPPFGCDESSFSDGIGKYRLAEVVLQ